MTHQKTERRRGFTLVEMMIALAIGAVITVIIMAFFSSLSSSTQASEQYREMHRDVRHAINVLQRDITRSSGVTDWNASKKLAMTTAKTGAGTGSVEVVYELSGGKLSRKEGPAAAETLATDVKAVAFTLYDSAGNVTTTPADAYFAGAEVEVEKHGVRETYTDKLQTRARMRTKNL